MLCCVLWSVEQSSSHACVCVGVSGERKSPTRIGRVELKTDRQQKNKPVRNEMNT